MQPFMSHWLLTDQLDDSIPMELSLFQFWQPSVSGLSPSGSSLYISSRVAASNKLVLSSNISTVLSLSGRTVRT